MYKVYQVKMGETLDNIASMFNTNVDTLKDINGINSVSYGDIIVVPSSNNWYKKYMVKKGDSIYAIAKENNISVDDLLMINGLEEDDYIYPGQELIIPENNVNIYITKKGDTLKNIARKMNTTLDNLVNQNDEIYLMEDQLIVDKK